VKARMSSPIRVVQVGLGPVGQMLTPFLLERPYLKLVGAVDIDPHKVGRDVGEVCRLDQKLNVKVVDGLDRLSKENADVALLTTTSYLSGVVPTLEQLAKLEWDVVSTCEELSYPWTRQPALAERIDAVARKHGISILSTGVNPGFLMDSWPITATSICRKVERIRIERIQDASQRRLPFQQKIGVGLSTDEFRARAASGKFGHVGLTESMQMIAARLGWKLNRTEDQIEPVLAEKDLDTALGHVKAGQAIGLQQIGKAFRGSDEIVTFVFRAALNQPDPADTLHVFGIPSFKVTIPGGIHGDIATCAVVTNAIPVVRGAAPGLRTMADLPPVGFCLEPGRIDHYQESRK
jgi:2,4-diaminopentanoate dehydrogenase